EEERSWPPLDADYPLEHPLLLSGRRVKASGRIDGNCARERYPSRKSAAHIGVDFLASLQPW
ncbi:hypothetical protein, partial [Mesorhizobium sp. M7A.F.Ca.CA.001.10.2.1]|uniref:hypothetical protein n=1 Tax=Mesorhizobium sp. M7A.F.Ca.CA.001.10.2.1 TaxID=2496720 RepID=UPI0019D0EA5C